MSTTSKGMPILRIQKGRQPKLPAMVTAKIGGVTFPTSPTRATAARSVLYSYRIPLYAAYTFIIPCSAEKSSFFQGSLCNIILYPIVVEYVQRPGIKTICFCQPHSDLHIFTVDQVLLDILNGAVGGVLSHIVGVCKDIVQLCAIPCKIGWVGGLHVGEVAGA